MRVILIRHGATAWSEQGRLTSHTDLPLSEEGRAEVRSIRPGVTAMVAALRTVSVAVSPATRAQETAAILFGQGRAWTTNDELREADFGECEGLSSAQYAESRPGWDFWRDGCPGGETFSSLVKRCGSLLEDIADLAQDQILVTHGVLIRALLQVARGLPLADGADIPVPCASVTALRLRPERHWELEFVGIRTESPSSPFTVFD